MELQRIYAPRLSPSLSLSLSVSCFVTGFGWCLSFRDRIERDRCVWCVCVLCIEYVFWDPSDFLSFSLYLLCVCCLLRGRPGWLYGCLVFWNSANQRWSCDVTWEPCTVSIHFLTQQVRSTYSTCPLRFLAAMAGTPAGLYHSTLVLATLHTNLAPD